MLLGLFHILCFGCPVCFLYALMIGSIFCQISLNGICFSFIAQPVLSVLRLVPYIHEAIAIAGLIDHIPALCDLIPEH